MIRKMVKGCILGNREIVIRANFKMITDTVMDKCTGEMGLHIKGNG